MLKTSDFGKGYSGNTVSVVLIFHVREDLIHFPGEINLVPNLLI